MLMQPAPTSLPARCCLPLPHAFKEEAGERNSAAPNRDREKGWGVTEQTAANQQT